MDRIDSLLALTSSSVIIFSAAVPGVEDGVVFIVATDRSPDGVMRGSRSISSPSCTRSSSWWPLPPSSSSWSSMPSSSSSSSSSSSQSLFAGLSIPEES